MPQEELAQLAARAQTELPYKMAAFEELARRHFGAIRGLAYGIVGDHDLAGGIAQDVLLRVMHGLPKLVDVEKYTAWARRITINVARSQLAKEKREAAKRAQYGLETDFTTDDHQPGASFAAMVKDLSVDEKTIVTLKIVDELEFNEIAAITGLGVSATKMRYYRALEKLKDQSVD